MAEDEVGVGIEAEEALDRHVIVGECVVEDHSEEEDSRDSKTIGNKISRDKTMAIGGKKLKS